MRIVRRDKRRNGGRIAIAFRGERRIIVVTDRSRRDVNFQTRVRRRRLAAAVPRGGGRRGGRLLIFVAIPAGCTTCVPIYIYVYIIVAWRQRRVRAATETLSKPDATMTDTTESRTLTTTSSVPIPPRVSVAQEHLPFA